MRDELSVYFENPAEDAMGYEHVEGRLFCGPASVELQFKEKDRAFRKNEPQVIPFEYNEVAQVTFVSGWFRPPILEFRSRSPEKLEAFPGADVGRVKLYVTQASKGDAKKAAAFIEYRQSEEYLRETYDRLDGKRNELDESI